MSQVPMTLRGAEKLRKELEELKTVKRPRIIASIAEAREHGDLKENAEYHAAREEQGFCEGRIQEIEAKLSNAQIIDVTKMPATGRVIFGCEPTFSARNARLVPVGKYCVYCSTGIAAWACRVKARVNPDISRKNRIISG